jgi:hypothetical protein
LKISSITASQIFSQEKVSSTIRHNGKGFDFLFNSMPAFDPQVPSCRRCQHYQVQGRRGGHCHKLNVNVQGSWDACPLAVPMFEAVLELSACLTLVPSWVGQGTLPHHSLDPALETAPLDSKDS